MKNIIKNLFILTFWLLGFIAYGNSDPCNLSVVQKMEAAYKANPQIFDLLNGTTYLPSGLAGAKFFELAAEGSEGLYKNYDNLLKLANDLKGGSLLSTLQGAPKLVKAWEKLIKMPQIRLDKKMLETFNKLADNPEITEVLPSEDLIQIIENLAKRGYPCRTCSNGSQLRNLDEVLIDMESAILKYGSDFSGTLAGFKGGANFSKGAEFVLDVITEFPVNFPKGTVFEFLPEGLNGARRVDVYVPGPPKIFYEMKSVAANNLPPENFSKQFINDLSNPEVVELSQIKWWFDGNEISSLPVQQFLDLLKNSTIEQVIIDKLVPTLPKTKQALIDLIEDDFLNIFSIK